MDCEGGGNFAGYDLLERPVETINLEDVDLVVAAPDVCKMRRRRKTTRHARSQRKGGGAHDAKEVSAIEGGGALLHRSSLLVRLFRVVSTWRDERCCWGRTCALRSGGMGIVFRGHS